MKPVRIIFLLTVGFTFACQPKKSPDSSQINLTQARGLTQAILKGELEKLDQYMAPDAINHAGMMGAVRGLADIKKDLSRIHDMSAGLQMEVLHEVADSVYVFQWLKFSGTAKTVADSVKGVNFESCTIQVLRFEDGLVIEHWEYRDPREMMKMLQGRVAKK